MAIFKESEHSRRNMHLNPKFLTQNNIIFKERKILYETTDIQETKYVRFVLVKLQIFKIKKN